MNKEICLGIGCIISGIGVILAPFMKESAEDRKQQEILTRWWQEMRQIASEEETYGTENNFGTGNHFGIGSNFEIESNIETGTDSGEASEEVVGILRIPAIDFENPVLKGASKQNLKISVATIEPTGTPGADGNFAIAGHNSRTYGRHFNRLSELKDGAELFVDTKAGNYAYTVTDVYVVEAEDVWVLGDTIDGAEITLITCHYPKEGKTQRLIVKGNMQ